MDEEHERCVAAMNAMAAERSEASLRTVLKVFSEHFAHEEMLLNEHLYKDLPEDGGFSADRNVRQTHYQDHERMLGVLRKQLRSMANAGGDMRPEFVASVMKDFEKHADLYDGGYADRLAAQLA